MSYLLPKANRDIDPIIQRKLQTIEQDIFILYNLMNKDNWDFMDNQNVELILLKIKAAVGDWFDGIVGLVSLYDIDISDLIKRTTILSKLRSEVIPSETPLEEYF